MQGFPGKWQAVSVRPDRIFHTGSRPLAASFIRYDKLALVHRHLNHASCRQQWSLQSGATAVWSVSLKNYCAQMLQECRSAVAEEAWSQGIITVLVRPGREIAVLDRIFWLHWFNIRTVMGARPDKG